MTELTLRDPFLHLERYVLGVEKSQLWVVVFRHPGGAFDDELYLVNRPPPGRGSFGWAPVRDGPLATACGPFRCTADPSEYYKEHPLNPKGCATIEGGIATDQALILGYHKADRDRPALQNRGFHAVPYRRWGWPGRESNYIGLAIHNRTKADKAVKVGAHSAGCIVMYEDEDLNTIIERVLAYQTKTETTAYVGLLVIDLPPTPETT